TPGARSCEGSFQGVGGVRLRYRALEVAQPRAALIVVHGLGEHSGRYESFAEAMTASGVSTYAYDQRGHGLSEGRRGHVGRFYMFLLVLVLVVREGAVLASVILTFSRSGSPLGGLAALLYLEKNPTRLNGAIILAPWPGTAAVVPRWKPPLAGVF